MWSTQTTNTTGNWTFGICQFAGWWLLLRVKETICTGLVLSKSRSIKLSAQDSQKRSCVMSSDHWTSDILVAISTNWSTVRHILQNVRLSGPSSRSLQVGPFTPIFGILTNANTSCFRTDLFLECQESCLRLMIITPVNCSQRGHCLGYVHSYMRYWSSTRTDRRVCLYLWNQILHDFFCVYTVYEGWLVQVMHLSCLSFHLLCNFDIMN